MKKYCLCVEVTNLSGKWLGDGWCTAEFPHVPTDSAIRGCIDQSKKQWADHLSLPLSKIRLKVLSISYMGES